MIEVPQRLYGRKGGREENNSIIFKVNGQLGIPAQDAIERVYAGLEGRDDLVVFGGPKVIMLRLEVCPIADCEGFLITNSSAVAWVPFFVSESQIPFILTIERPLSSFPVIRSDSITGRSPTEDQVGKARDRGGQMLETIYTGRSCVFFHDSPPN
jgi:hypothetical protein